MVLPTGSRSRFGNALRCLLACAIAAGVARSARAQDVGVLTTIKAVRALTPEAAKAGRRVAVRGTVTYVNERDPAGIIIHDGQAGLFVHYGRKYIESHAQIDLHAGDVLDVDGHTNSEGFAPDVVPADIRKIGRAALPSAKTVPFTALMSGMLDCDYIEVAGVGQRAWLSESGKILFLDVAIEGGIVRAWFWDFSPQDVTRFIDAQVRLRGSAGTLYNSARQVRGISLFAARTADALVDMPAPDPSTLPTRAISSLYTHHAMDQINRRVRVRGIVTGTQVGQPTWFEDITMHLRFRDVRHRIYVRDDTSAALIETEQPFQLSPGDVVDVAGFPIISSTRPRLHNAVIRAVSHESPPAPRAIARDTLLAEEHDSALVTIDAELLTEVTTPAGKSMVLKAGDTVFEARRDPSSTTASPTLDGGSIVVVTGIYAFEPGPPPSFRVLLRSSDDVVLLSTPRWWTPKHSAVLLVFMALTGIAGLVWARMIAHKNAMVREQYRAILAERSRLATELHDTLEQGLAGIQLQLGAVARTLDSSPQSARHALGTASEMLRYSLAEARRSVMDLRHSALETRDLAGALTEVAAQMTTGTPVSVHVRTIGQPRPLDRSQEHHLLRIGLEALTNAIKHSGATAVDVELRFEARDVRLVVSDNGAGFAEPTLDHSSGHFGLRGIRERVDKMGGALRLENGLDGGAIVAVTAPGAGAAGIAGENRHA